MQTMKAPSNLLIVNEFTVLIAEMYMQAYFDVEIIEYKQSISKSTIGKCKPLDNVTL